MTHSVYCTFERCSMFCPIRKAQFAAELVVLITPIRWWHNFSLMWAEIGMAAALERSYDIYPRTNK